MARGRESRFIVVLDVWKTRNEKADGEAVRDEEKRRGEKKKKRKLSNRAEEKGGAII